MSRVLWHARDGQAEILGSERVWCARLAEGPAVAAWDLGHSWALDKLAPIMAAIPERQDDTTGSNYLHVYYRQALAAAQYDPGPARQFLDTLATALRVRSIEIVIAGHRLGLGNVDLNTALLTGSDVIKLAAKIHGWCESHCYIEGPDRAWAAGLIEDGLKTRLFRPAAGWQDAQKLLRTTDDGPVVLSYTVCDSFPREDFHPDRPRWIDGFNEDWSKLEKDQQREWEDWSERFHKLWKADPGGVFDACMGELRRRRPWARLSPDTLGEVWFGPPVTVYDLLCDEREERVRAACAMPTSGEG